MKSTTSVNTTQSAKKAYKTPNLIKHGSVAQITLKGGSAFDVMTPATNDFQP